MNDRDALQDGCWAVHDAAELATFWPGAAFRTSVDTPFSAVVQRRVLRTSLIEGVRATPYVCERTTEMVAAHPLDIVTVNIVIRGSLLMSDQARSFEATSGDVFVHRSGAFRYECFGDSETLRTVVPPGLVLEMAYQHADFFGLVALSEASSLFSQFAQGLLAGAGADLSSRSARQLEPALLLLQQGILAEMAQAICRESGPADRLRRRAIDLIEARMSEPSLRAADVAVALGVSRRSVFLAFAGGESFSAVLRRRRLETAAALIASDPALPAADIARRTGFAGRDALTRAFRSQYGRSVADHRREASNRSSRTNDT